MSPNTPVSETTTLATPRQFEVPEGALIQWCQPTHPLDTYQVPYQLAQFRIHDSSGPLPTRATPIAFDGDGKICRVRLEALAPKNLSSLGFRIASGDVTETFGARQATSDDVNIHENRISFEVAGRGTTQDTSLELNPASVRAVNGPISTDLSHAAIVPSGGGLWWEIRAFTTPTGRSIYRLHLIWNNHDGANPSSRIRFESVSLRVPGNYKAFSEVQGTRDLPRTQEGSNSRIHLSEADCLLQTHRFTSQIWLAPVDDEASCLVAEANSNFAGWSTPHEDSLWSDHSSSEVLPSRHAARAAVPKMSGKLESFRQTTASRLRNFEDAVYGGGSQNGHIRVFGNRATKGSVYGGTTGGYDLGTDECLREYLAGTPEAGRLLYLRRWIEQGRGVGDIYYKGDVLNIGTYRNPSWELPDTWASYLRSGTMGYNYEVFGTFDDERPGRGWIGPNGDPFGFSSVEDKDASDPDAFPWEEELVQFDPDDQQHAARRDQELQACAAMHGNIMDLILLWGSAVSYLVSYYHGDSNNRYVDSLGVQLKDAEVSLGRGVDTARGEAWMETCMAEAAFRCGDSNFREALMESGDAFVRMLSLGQQPSGNVEAHGFPGKLSEEKSQDIVAANRAESGNSFQPTPWRPICQNWTNDLQLHALASWFPLLSKWSKAKTTRTEMQSTALAFIDTLVFWWDEAVGNWRTNGAVANGPLPADHDDFFAHCLDAPHGAVSEHHDDFYFGVRASALIALPITRGLPLGSVFEIARQLLSWSDGDVSRRLDQREATSLGFDWGLWLLMETVTPDTLSYLAKFSETLSAQDPSL